MPEIAPLSLINTGVQVLNAEQPCPAQRTLVVLGVARSGTTMVAGALQQLGIEMFGGGKRNPVFEDVPLAEALEARDVSRARLLIAQRDQHAEVWGWKRPSALTYIRRVEKHLRNPEYVVVFRDLMAIANRNQISVRADLLDNMAEALVQYRSLLDFLAHSRRRTLVFSYEKAMLDKPRFVAALADFVGVADPQRREQAQQFICENSEAYLSTSKTWHSQGEVLIFERDRVSGWAAASGSVQPVSVELLINDKLYGSMVADLPRVQVRDRGLHPTGACGFNFRLPQMRQLKNGDRVSVRVVGELRPLSGKALIFKET